MIDQKAYSLCKSVQCAYAGFRQAAKTEMHFRAEIVIAVIVLIVMWFLPLTSTERIGVCAWIVGVLVVELLNTAIEYAINATVTTYSPHARDAKDASAAAVLLVVIGASVYASILAVRIGERLL